MMGVMHPEIEAPKAGESRIEWGGVTGYIGWGVTSRTD